MTKPAEEDPPDEPAQPIVSSLLQTTSVPPEAEAMQAIANEIVSLSEEVQAAHMLVVSAVPSIAVIDEEADESWDDEPPAELPLQIADEPDPVEEDAESNEARCDDVVPDAASQQETESVPEIAVEEAPVDEPSLPPISLAAEFVAPQPVVAVIPPPDDNQVTRVFDHPLPSPPASQPPGRLFRWLVPSLWAVICWTLFSIPGDEYGIWGLSSFAGIWLPMFIPVSTSVHVIFWWVLVVGTAVMAVVGYGLDRLRASAALWLGLTALLAAGLGWLLVRDYETWTAALMKNGSFWTYVLGPLNFAHTVVSLGLLAITGLVRLVRQRWLADKQRPD